MREQEFSAIAGHARTGLSVGGHHRGNCIRVWKDEIPSPGTVDKSDLAFSTRRSVLFG